MKTRVVFFAEILIDDFDGAARTMFQLIRRIPKEEFEFLFVCGTGPETLEGFTVLKLPTFHIPGNESYKMVSPFIPKKKIFKTIEAFQPHVVHIATPSFLGHFGKEVAKKLNLPILTIFHTHFKSYIPYYFKNAPFLIPPATRWAVKTLKSFYNSADRIYVPSESLSVEIQSDGIEEKRIQIWKRGIDRKLFSPTKRNDRLLLGNNKPIVLFASRLVMEKNLQVLFDLYPLLEEKGYQLVVAGNGVAFDEAQRKMPNAQFLGHTPHETLAEWYATCDVYFFPSVTETFGNVVLEAMACGAPCVISDQGGSKDFIENGVNGFLCSAYDAQAYMKRIVEIIENPDLKKTLSQNARAYTAAFDWEHLANIYFEDLKSLA